MDLTRIAKTGLLVAGKAADRGLSFALGVVRRVRGQQSPASRSASAAPPTPASTAEPASSPRSGRFAREISNPKRARAARQRETAASTEDAHVEGASGRGGTPASVAAENTPSDLAAKRAGRGPAPLGSDDAPSGS